MKLRHLMFVALVAATSLATGAAQQFPHLQEEDLNGRQIALPDVAAGKVAVLVIGFSHASGTPSGEWAKRAREDFGKNTSFLLYQLAVIEEAPRLVRGMITSGMKKGTPESQRGNFVPVVHQEAELKKLVNYKEADDAYIVVLDRSGKVVYQAHGATVDSNYAGLHAKVQSLLQ